jgi:arylsulfatase A-like enzyme
VPLGWDSWTAFLDPHPDQWDFDVNKNGVIVHYAAPAYKNQVAADRASAFLANALLAEDPFFLWFAPTAPHNAANDHPLSGRCEAYAQPDPADNGTYAAEPLPMPLSFMEADVSDKPADIQGKPVLGQRYIDRATVVRQCRLESLLSVDRAVDRFLDQLRAAGELRNTLVIFTSDNGFFLGEHRITTGKLRFYEESTKVPLFIRGPGFPAGLSVREAVGNVDLAPTILQATGATPGRVQDGVALQDLAAAGSMGSEPDRKILLEKNFGPILSGEDGNSGPPYVAIHGWRYVLAEFGTGEREFYDLQLDPYQLTNAIGNPAYAARIQSLHNQLSRLATCEGSDC